VDEMPQTETHKGFRKGENNANGDNCWSCGHWLIGGGCWKYGHIGEPGWRDTNPDDSCEEWVPEGTEGTITGLIHQNNAQSPRDDLLT
jgi:hypothetical protein